jgi:glycosyltransferase involved in cell wall biosynthesis
MLFPILAARRAQRLLQRERYDLLYGYEVHGVLAQRRVRRQVDLPLVARFQGTVMHPHLGRRLSLLRRYEEVQALRTPADVYVMTNDGTQGDEVLRTLNPASEGRVRFWRNGLDLANTRPPAPEDAAQARTGLGLTADDFVLVTASRLARWKRIDRAIDAVALLDRHGLNARLLVVGDGEERQNLEAQARDLGVSDRVRFVGGVPQPEVQRYLWAADVFLSVNELSNVGNPLLEAMMTRRCILTLDEGDTRDLIEDGVTGVLLPTGEPAAIADALVTLAGDPALRERLADGALDYARQHFWSWDQRLDAEVDAIEALVGRPEPAAVDV